MAEFSIDLEPRIKDSLQTLIKKVESTKSVRKMNKMLYECKEQILSLKFHPENQHHAFLKEQLIKFGIPSNQFEQAWLTIKKVWASKFNERAFLATKKLGVKIN